MERKVFISDIKGIDEKEMTMTATISSNAKDRQGEVLEPKGVDLKNYLKNPVVLWAHDYSLPPIGKALWVRRDGDTVISKVQFAKTPFAQEIFQLFKEGFLKAFSVGFMPKQWEDGDGQKTPYRTYTKWEMLEYSAVPVPANPEAIALAMSKGILKDEALIKSFAQQEEEPVQEFNNECKEMLMRKECGCCGNCDCEGCGSEKANGKCDCGCSMSMPSDKPPMDMPKSIGLEELIDNNKLLSQQNETLEKENAGLKFKLYEILAKRQEKPSEITVDQFESKALEMIDRVIRKHQGKVD